MLVDRDVLKIACTVKSILWNALKDEERLCSIAAKCRYDPYNKRQINVVVNQLCEDDDLKILSLSVRFCIRQIVHADMSSTVVLETPRIISDDGVGFVSKVVESLNGLRFSKPSSLSGSLSVIEI